MRIDLTVVAIPAYVGAMAAEYAWQKRNPRVAGTRAGDYEFKDTMASLSMGLGSLLAPHVSKALFGSLSGRGRAATAALGLAVGSGTVATVVDVLRRHRRGELPEAGVVPEPRPTPTTYDVGAAHHQRPAELPPVLNRIGRAAAVSSVATTALVAATEWGASTASKKIFG